ncbi:MAG: SH3 domain-containing protein [Alphaproteobacteria bacterium]
MTRLPIPTLAVAGRLAAIVTLAVALLIAAAPPVLAQTTDDGSAPAARAAPTSATTQPPAIGSVTGLALPRYVSLRGAEANLRTGPGLRYPIDWVYQRAGMPLLVVAEFEQWRRVRDRHGDEGWLHRALLSVRRTAIVVADEPVALRRAASADAAVVAWLAGGVIAALGECADGWCRLSVAGHDGWVRRAALWGP